MFLNKRHAITVAVCVVGGLFAPEKSAAQSGLRDDGQSHPPPATGATAYNTFVPPSSTGASYLDPVFGTKVMRVTTDHSVDDLYARNMWWNANETRFIHRNPNGTAFADFFAVIDVASGSVTHNGIP